MRDALAWLAALFGAPGEVRAAAVLKKRDHALLLSWLRSLEALAVRLLLLAALSLPSCPPARPAAPRRRPENPERPAVGVSFHAPAPAKAPLPLRRPAAPRAPAPIENQAPQLGCLRAAARFAALCRLVADPAPYARRLAQRLARDGGALRRLLDAPIRAGDPFAEKAQAAQALLVQSMPGVRQGPAPRPP
ncbi:MAG: hypothetical protein AB7L65_00085 [Hyphomonadaceae bacterium]